MENNIGEFYKIENNPKSLLEKGRLIIKKIEGISDQKLKERFLRMLKILSIPILLSLPSLGLSQNESKEFNDFFDNFNSLEMSKDDEKDNGSKIKLNIAIGKFGYENDEKAVENIVNFENLRSYKRFARNDLIFRNVAGQYFNTFQAGEQKFAYESKNRTTRGKDLNPNSNYYFIPKGQKIDEFTWPISNAEECDEIYLSEDGKYYIISEDIQDYTFGYNIIDTNFNPELPGNLEVTPEEIKENIWVNPEEARSFGISIPEMREAVYNILDIIDKIEITTDDLLSPSNDNTFPETSNPEKYFLVNEERQKQIEENFIENLKEASKNFSEGQKLVILSTLGNIYNKSSNDKIGDMGQIPFSISLMAAKIYNSEGWRIPVGVCRHINTNVIKTAHEALGFDGFVKSTYAKGPHAIGG